MPMAIHPYSFPTPTALLEFADPETRFVYAKYKEAQESDALFYLKNGEATAKRDWAKENLICPFPGCPDPLITTVARVGGRRDGFRHIGTSLSRGHAGESLFHLQGKAFLKRWVEEKYPNVKVFLEKATESKSNRPDVTLEWESGAKLAIEVQYSPISFVDWKKRSDSLESQGYNVSWLFGHTYPHFPSWLIEQKKVSINLNLQQIQDSGVNVLWFNPIDEQVVSFLTKKSEHICSDPECFGRGANCNKEFIRLAQGKEKASFLHIDSFANAVLSEQGIVPLAYQAIAEEEPEYQAAINNQKLREAYFLSKKPNPKTERTFESDPYTSDWKPLSLEENTIEIERRRTAYWARDRAERIAKGWMLANGESVESFELDNPNSRTGFACRVCGFDLDKDFAKKTGRHYGC